MAGQPIKFVFEGDTTDLEKALAQVGKQFEKADDKAKKTGITAEKAAKAAKVGMLAAAAAAAALTVAFAKTASAALDLAAKADKIAKSAAAVGTSAEEFQKVVGAFELGGLQAEATEAAIKKLGLRIGQVAAGAGGPAAEAFEKLSITAAELEALPLAERMAVIADRVAELGTQSQRATVLNALFEESGLQMAGAFAQGGDAIRDAAQKIEDAGIISNEVAKQAEAMSDAVALAERAWEGLKTEALAPIIPLITAVAEEVSVMLGEFRKTGDVAQFGETFVSVFLDAIAPAAVEASATIVNALAAIPAAAAGVEAGLARIKQVAMAAEDIGFTTASQAQSLFKLFKGLPVLSDETLAVTGEVTGAQEKLAQAIRDLGAVQDSVAAKSKRAHQAIENIRDALKQAKPEAEGAAKEIEEVADAMEEVSESAEEAAPKVELVVKSVRIFNKELEDAKKAAAEIVEAFDPVGGAIAEIAGSVGDLFAQIGSNIADAIADSQEKIADLDDRIAQAETDRERESLARKKRMLEEELKEQKKAALATFAIQKAVAITQATIQGALAVLNALATGGAAAPALAIAAGIASGISIAAIAAEPPPSFHVGGMVAQAAPDEINARLLRSEAVLSPQGVNAVGGEEGVRQLNRGMGGAGQPIVSVLQVRSRTVDAMISDNLRTKQGPLVDALRAARPRALGRHNPFASS